MKYIIASGWWSCQRDEDTRDQLIGDDQIRNSDFHTLWYQCIKRFTNADEIVVIDSASPIKPENINDETWISLRKNFGHSTNHESKYSGVSRSFMMSMMYAFANDYDYWVYIEQDALIYGDNIIEQAIKNSYQSIIWGDGKGTPQPTQQSLMIFEKNQIPVFLYHYEKINCTDAEISPEWKFLFAANSLARILPSTTLKYLANPSKSRIANLPKKIFIKFLRLFDRFDDLPFGYGRVRPINFEDSHFYFQHGDKQELKLFLNKLNPEQER